jgi:hypothetical protein
MDLNHEDMDYVEILPPALPVQGLRFYYSIF